MQLHNSNNITDNILSVALQGISRSMGRQYVRSNSICLTLIEYKDIYHKDVILLDDIYFIADGVTVTVSRDVSLCRNPDSNESTRINIQTDKRSIAAHEGSLRYEHIKRHTYLNTVL